MSDAGNITVKSATNNARIALARPWDPVPEAIEDTQADEDNLFETDDDFAMDDFDNDPD